MKGINRYDQIREGIQHNFSMGRDLDGMIKEATDHEIPKPCVFLSHKSEDKGAVIDVAKYLSDAGVNYYLDVNDPNLQLAVNNNDHKKITDFIELGINNSTHVLSIISDKTKSSWWVPFEIGYGKRGDKNLALLPLKEVNHVPSYLSIIPKLDGIKQLNDYIESIKSSTIVLSKSASANLLEMIEALTNKTICFSNTAHPLANHLKRL